MLCGPGAQGWISGFSSLVWMLGCLVFAKPSYKQAQTTMRADGDLFFVQERLHVLWRQFGQWALAQSRDQVQRPHLSRRWSTGKCLRHRQILCRCQPPAAKDDNGEYGATHIQKKRPASTISAA